MHAQQAASWLRTHRDMTERVDEASACMAGMTSLVVKDPLVAGFSRAAGEHLVFRADSTPRGALNLQGQVLLSRGLMVPKHMRYDRSTSIGRSERQGGVLLQDPCCCCARQPRVHRPKVRHQAMAMYYSSD